MAQGHSDTLAQVALDTSSLSSAATGRDGERSQRREGEDDRRDEQAAISSPRQ
jgi:hypothetical protein